MIKVCKVCGKEKEMHYKATTCPDCIKAGYKFCICCEKVLPLDQFHTLHGKPLAFCARCDTKRSSASKKKHKAKHTKRVKEYNKAYYQRPEVKRRRAERCKERYYTDESYREYVRLRDNKRRSVDDAGTLTPDEWHDICESFNYRCAYCGSEHDITIDHIVPISKGGSTDVGNVVPACGHCNRSKGAKDIIEWYTAQPFYDKSKLEVILRVAKKGGAVK